MDTKDIIKTIRMQLKMTQTDFAESVGMSRSVIANYEGGTVEPGYKFLYQLILKHNVNPNYLFTGNGPILKFSDSTNKLTQFSELFPMVPPEPEILELIELLEVPVFRYHMMKEFFIGKNELMKFINEYYQSKTDSENEKRSQA